MKFWLTAKPKVDRIRLKSVFNGKVVRKQNTDQVKEIEKESIKLYKEVEGANKKLNTSIYAASQFRCL
jgi:hypothetical protein